MIQLSVYHIYSFAWLLAIGAMVLTAIILLDTFRAVQDTTDRTQREIGMDQVKTLNLTVSSALNRMRIETSCRMAEFLLHSANFSSEDFNSENFLGRISPILLAYWTPYVQSADEVYGYIVNMLYPSNTALSSEINAERSLQVYADILADSSRQMMASITNDTDALEHAYEIVFNENNAPAFGPKLYTFEWFNSSLKQALFDNDFYFPPFAWTSSDGSSFWYYVHQQYFRTPQGAHGTMMTLATGVLWHKTMRTMRSDGSEFVVFDSNNMTITATADEELRRLYECRAPIAEGAATAACISSQSSEHPTEQIRHVFKTFYEPSWNDLNAPPMPFESFTFHMDEDEYVAVMGTLYSKDRLRLTVVWYQPQTHVNSAMGWVTALICIMTILSTTVLSILGIFGVLLPLMRLGQEMQSVAASLNDGDGEVVIEARKPSPFIEVDHIGQDFETIVVDFLGFSSRTVRDNKHAPKDASKPFAVIFTDIESSTGLWGKDPVTMATCIQTHHEMIRKLIAEHHMYEVKTVGDSFMVVTTSPLTAIMFAMNLQLEFVRYDWDWSGLEEFYHETHKMDAKKGDDSVWNGLRVRIGITFGMGEITYDVVSKGYDYYGPVVNTASRIEAVAHGGQVVVGRCVLDALSPPFDSTTAIVFPLGEHLLRGVEKPQELFQVLPFQLSSRYFPPLRLDKEHDDDAMLSARTACSRRRPSLTSEANTVDGSVYKGHWMAIADDLAQNHSLVKAGTLPAHTISCQLQAIKETIEDLLMPLPHQQRSTTFKAIVKGWGIPPPRSQKEMASCMLHIANRMMETAKAVLKLRASQQASKIVHEADILAASQIEDCKIDDNDVVDIP